MSYRSITTYCLFSILFLLATTLVAPARGELPLEQKSRILILNSYHPNYTWSDNEISGIMEELKKARPGMEPIVEYLDCKYFPRMDHFEHIAELFKHKYKGITIPVVIVADNPALEFALTYRRMIFPKAPIIFCGINGFEPSMLHNQGNVTGVAELLDVRGTVELMLKLHPETKEIFIIHDYTPTGLATRSQADRDLSGMEKIVALRFMKNVTTDEMLQQIKSLPKTSLVLALSYSRDSEGRVFDHTQIARLLGDNSPVPVYAGHEERLGHGVVGGNLLGGKIHGAMAARMALEILGGKQVETMPVSTEKTVRTMFDYHELSRFNIPLTALPTGSIVINKEVSFYEQHTTLVWATVGLFSSLTMIITLLAINTNQKRKSNRALAQKAIELERANAELHEFTMLSYHDLQEPLRNIGGFVQLLEKRYKGKLGDDADEYIRITVQNVSYMKQLFNDLLNYIRLTPKEMRKAEHDGALLLNTALARLKEQIGCSKALVTFSKLPHLYGDQEMLVTLFFHLISNALKFSKESPKVHIGYRLEDNHVILSVQDNGLGIASEYHTRIFQIFKKLNPRSKFEGTGIGLSICKRISELHGANIWLESQPGEGSTFFVSLPCK